MKTSMRSACRVFGIAALILFGNTLATRADDTDGDRRASGYWAVGTWYLALDSEPFGLPPGLPLSGLAQFDSDGNFRTLDAGDFGQATFTNTQHSQQFGVWRRDERGRVVGTSLFLEADLFTGEVLRWNKVQFVVRRTGEDSLLTGHATVSVLECVNALPIPTSLTCPDPISASDDFVLIPPIEIPVTFSRLNAQDQ
jgi:hypothetical protein